MKKKVALISLGCSKNLVDSEHMLGILRDKGYEICIDEAEAEILIINTCAFIESAKEEAINCILEMAEYKKTGSCKLLIVTGCLAQRYSTQVQEEIPEVDIVLGTNAYTRITDVIEEYDFEEPVCLCPNTPVSDEEIKRLRVTPPYTAYLRIADGCDNNCTYCIIPSIRGRYRSRRMEDIIEEARAMAKDGVKEVIVIAQDTTRYGKDLYGEYSLSKLLREICKVDGILWVRVHYCYPELVDDELIKTFKEEEKLCPYFDIPIQHCNDKVLRRMGRRTNKAEITALLDKIRKEIPDATIRTSIIVGFPGETEEQFKELCDFVREVKFDRLGVFAYSREEDTPAYKLNGQIDEEEKQKRQEVLMLIQSEISEENNNRKIGKVVKVLVEGRDAVIKQYYGRTKADSIEVDGKVFFTSNKKINEGDFADVELTDALEYDFLGAEVEKEV